MIHRALRGVASLGHPVLATTAAAESSAIPADLGPHVRLERFIPHDHARGLTKPQVLELSTSKWVADTGRAAPRERQERFDAATPSDEPKPGDDGRFPAVPPTARGAGAGL
jgi:hypothetical protein